MNSAFDTEPPDPFGGVEKQQVRDFSWYPLLRRRKELSAGRLRYLTLPARQLTEIRALVDEGIIEGPNDLVLIERDLLSYYNILRDTPLLPFSSKIEPICVIHGNVNELLEKDNIVPYLPVDAVNLDYYGFFGGGEDLQSTQWKALKKLVSVQASLGG